MRRRLPWILPWLAAAGALATGPGRAESEEPPSLRVVWTDAPPVVDGRLDEAAWADAALVSDLVQVEPVEGAPPSQRTEIRILTDGHSLFFAFRCHDTNPEAIVARRMLRDDRFFYDDRVNITLDPFHDHRTGYFFQVSPVGGRRDGTFEGIRFEQNWDGIWFARATRDPGGWTAEIAIPFETLNFDPEADVWGLNLERGIRRNDELDRWADPHARRSVVQMGRAGHLAGMRGVLQGLGLDLKPNLTVRRVDDPIANRHFWKIDPSGDVFYKLLPSLTAVVTANTDFGETEVDARQVNLTRFALFFPEKRDFFLQDAGIFTFANLSENGRPFFSRRIGLDAKEEPADLHVGGKITGRVGRFNVGVLDTFVEGSADNLAVARLTMNVLEESKIGAIFTHGDPLSTRGNALAGADFNYSSSRFRGDKTLQGTAWLQKSFREGVDGDDLAFGGNLSYPNDLVHWQLGMLQIEKGFSPALGFVNRVGIREFGGDYRYRIRRTGRARTLDARLSGFVITDLGNDVESGFLVFRPLVLTTDIEGVLDVRYEHGFERLDRPFAIKDNVTIAPGSYHFDRGGVRVEMSHNYPLRGLQELSFGTFFDGWRLESRSGLEWRPSPHVGLVADYEHNEIWSIGTLGKRFRTRIVSLRLELSLSPDLSFTTLAQYDNASDTVGINSRIRWLVTDGREVFLVLNQDLAAAGGDLRRGRTEPLVKVGWTFRF